jgi:rhamnosyl/mannosyltransferase
VRILQVGKFPKEHCGGVENAVFSLSEALARDHEVEVVTSSLDGRAAESRDAGVRVRSLPTWGRLFSAPITPSLISYLKRASGFDVIQISFQNPMAALAYALARPEGRLVVWYHHDIIRQRLLGLFLHPLIRHVLSKASRIVATSASYAAGSGVLRRFSHKTTVIPLGIDISRFQTQAARSEAKAIRSRHGAPLILFVGRLVYYKGLPTLLEAMPGLEARLLIIGQGPLEASLRAQVESLGLGGKVDFLKVPREESVAPYLHACDLLVLPSTERTEAFGLVLLEAMACGKPVVATELGTGTSFVCQDKVTGLVVPPRDAPALSRALRSLLSDPDRARRMGEEGKKRAASLFSLQTMADSFVKLYQGLPC